MLSTLEEIRDNIAFTTRETQIDDEIDQYINLTLNEINDYHLWSFLRRKTTFSTVADQEDYQLPRDVDKIGLLRQTDTPLKLKYVPDNLFYKWIPDPTATGNPKYYRLWEEYGVETQISSAETVNVVSSSTSDGSSVTLTVIGTDANGYEIVETYTLNGTTTVSGAKSFTTIRQVSKSSATTGNITVSGNTSATTFVTLLPEERSPRFKRVSLYNIPSSAITMYLEYYTRLRELVNDQDVPAIDRKWHYLIREGALAKVYQYQNKKEDYLATIRVYLTGLERMKKEDVVNVDFIPMLKNTTAAQRIGILEVSDSIIDSSGFIGSW